MMARLFRDLSPREENDKNQPKGVVSGKKDTEQPGCQPEGVPQAGQRCEDDLFAEEARQGRQPGEGRSRYDQTHHGYFQPSAAVSGDLVNIVRLVQVDPDPGAEEEQRLEARMGGQMEAPREEAPRGEPHDHEAQLADSGVRPDSLDVPADHGHGGGQEHGDGADGQKHGHRIRRVAKEWKQAGEQVDAGSHHGGRVEQGADRCGALHSVRQPRHERKLRAFADDAAEDQEGRQGQKAGGHAGRCLRAVHLQDLQVPQVKQHQEKADEKRNVAQTGHDKCLLSRLGGAELLVPEADQQIRRKPDQLPEDVKLKHGRGDAQGHHRPCEKGLKRIVAGETGVASHVAEGVDLNKKTDGRHQGQHEQAHRVEQKPKGDVNISRNEPSGGVVDRLARTPVSNQQKDGPGERARHRRDSDPSREPTMIPGEHDDEQERDERQPRGQYRRHQTRIL